MQERQRQRQTPARPSTDQVEGVVGRLLAAQPLGVLATQGRGQPHTSLVAFVASDDCTAIVFATGRSTRKFRNVTRHREVSFLVDDRSNSPADFEDAVAVSASGPCDQLQGEERSAWAERYVARHPHLKTFVGAPTCALMRIHVEQLDVVTSFQQVHTGSRVGRTRPKSARKVRRVRTG